MKRDILTDILMEVALLIKLDDITDLMRIVGINLSTRFSNMFHSVFLLVSDLCLCASPSLNQRFLTLRS